MTFFPASKASPLPPNESTFRGLLRAVGQRLFRSAAAFLSRCTPLGRAEYRNAHGLAISEKRRHSRLRITAAKVHVTDGCFFATGLIDNISPGGICLCHLPERLYRDSGKLTVFSSDDPGLPILHIEPRWEKTSWDGKTIGAEVLNPSETWPYFSTMPPSDWGMDNHHETPADVVTPLLRQSCCPCTRQCLCFQ